MKAGGDGQLRRSWLAWLALIAVLLVSVQAARAAFVAAEGVRRPEIARLLWPSHPLPQVTLALAGIGAAAREGRAPPVEALALMRSAGRSDPLGVEPLLVSATERLAAGDRRHGERLLKAALHREPRSTAAHFLLADLYVREQRVGDALVHVAVLGRRIRGGGIEPFAAALAAYLRDSNKIADVKPVLEDNAQLRTLVMAALAQDPAGATALRGLSRRGDANENWFRNAFERQLAVGNVREARSLLAAARVPGGGTGLTAWTAEDNSGPLSWRFPASADGIAEAVQGGPVRMVYYGRADAALADHLLLLPPGRFRFQAQFGGTIPPATFEWRVTCLQGARQIALWPVTSAAAVLAFDVPADCPAQRLALWGRLGEFPRTVSLDLLKASVDPLGAVQ
jgi:hypothetical protein